MVGYSPWGRKESDMAEQLHFTSLQVSKEELPHVRGQGQWLKGATPGPRGSGWAGEGREELLHARGQEGWP